MECHVDVCVYRRDHRHSGRPDTGSEREYWNWAKEQQAEKQRFFRCRTESRDPVPVVWLFSSLVRSAAGPHSPTGRSAAFRFRRNVGPAEMAAGGGRLGTSLSVRHFPVALHYLVLRSFPREGVSFDRAVVSHYPLANRRSGASLRPTRRRRRDHGRKED
jgi:hypothetical protein